MSRRCAVRALRAVSTQASIRPRVSPSETCLQIGSLRTRGSTRPITSVQKGRGARRKSRSGAYRACPCRKNKSTGACRGASCKILSLYGQDQARQILSRRQWRRCPRGVPSTNQRACSRPTCQSCQEFTPFYQGRLGQERGALGRQRTWQNSIHGYEYVYSSRQVEQTITSFEMDEWHETLMKQSSCIICHESIEACHIVRPMCSCQEAIFCPQCWNEYLARGYRTCPVCR